MAPEKREPAATEERGNGPRRSGDSARRGTPAEGWTFAPALTPLLIGFTLLLALVLTLGTLSIRQVKEVGINVTREEGSRARQLDLLLKLRLAVIRLNNEARARADAESEGGVLMPFEVPLRNARSEVRKLLTEVERAATGRTEKWRTLAIDLSEYLAATEDTRAYSLDGFGKFQKVEADINSLLDDINRKETENKLSFEQQEKRAIEAIWSLTLALLLTGVGVAVGTGWEVQRRFRQVRRSLDEARRERRFSAQILEGMVSGMAAIDQEGRIRSANALFFEIFPAAIIGGPLRDAAPDAETKARLDEAISVPVERSTYHGRWMIGAGGEGNQRAFDVYSSPLEIEGERGQILTLMDATEVAEAEAELRRQESLAAVGQATAQVAHEIKNPLGSIRLGVAMLREMMQGPEAQRTIDLVDRGIDHLNKLTVDVTQFSRQRPLMLTEVDLRRLLDTSLELVADRLREKKTPVEKHFKSGDLRGRWDESALQQVFVNLLANAIDASAEGSPVIIEVETVGSDNSSNGGRARRPRVRVTIADHGSGIDEATRARIFEPFFTTKKRGTGLGLAIVKKIIDQHGGAITVASTPGEGTQFTVELPLN
jgi:signal transduction histidine kinase